MRLIIDFRQLGIGALMEAILQAIDEHAEGMTVVSVIGCLEIAKIAVLDESEGD